MPTVLHVEARLASWLRIQYPRSTGKLVARVFGVSLRTATRMIAGEHITTAHVNHAIRLWGQPFLSWLSAEITPADHAVWGHRITNQLSGIEDVGTEISRLKGLYENVFCDGPVPQAAGAVVESVGSDGVAGVAVGR